MKRREALGIAAIAGAGLALSEGLGGVLSSNLPTRRIEPGADVGQLLNRAIAELSAEGGGTIALSDGIYGTARPIKLLSNVAIVGDQKTVIKAMAPIGDAQLRLSLIETPRGQSNCRIANLTLNCDGNVSFAAWSAIAPHALTCENVRVIGWNFGLYFVSSRDRGAEDITIKDTIVRAGGPVQVYPVFISSKVGGKPVRNLTIEGLTINGSRGSYSASNNATADQLALQNVHGFTLKRVESYGAGENGIVVVRGCRDGLLEDIAVAGADGHGLQVGGGGVLATLDNGSNFAKGQKTEGLASEGRAQVDLVDGNHVWLSRLTKRQLRVGEKLRGPHGSARIQELGYCRNIRVVGLTARGNGRNEDGVRGKFADLYISHAEHIDLDNLNLGSPKPALSVIINNSRNIPCHVDRRRNASSELHAGRVDCET